MARPRTPLLSRELIRDVTLRLVDEHGLDAVSMRRIAAELGVRAPSLYSHYATKEELLDDIADASVNRSTSAGSPRTTGRKRSDAGLAPTATRSPRTRIWCLPRLESRHPARLPPASDAIHGGLTRAGWPPRFATMIGARSSTSSSVPRSPRSRADSTITSTPTTSGIRICRRRIGFASTPPRSMPRASTSFSSPSCGNSGDDTRCFLSPNAPIS